MNPGIEIPDPDENLFLLFGSSLQRFIPLPCALVRLERCSIGNLSIIHLFPRCNNLSIIGLREFS